MLQPVLDARSGAVHAYSVHIRLPAQNGRDTTAERVALAESAGLIVDLDLAVLRKTLEWLKKKTPVNAEPVVAVRISGQTVDTLSALAQIDQIIRDNPWIRGRLIFEITQSSRIAAPATANAGIQRLREQGIQVCLCDFATSAYGFQYLADLEVDSVKLAAEAVDHARDARQGKAYVKALMAFCREFGVATMAGGVDDEATFRLVRGCGVQFVQGALFGQPSADARILAAQRLRTCSRTGPVVADASGHARSHTESSRYRRKGPAPFSLSVRVLVTRQVLDEAWMPMLRLLATTIV